MRWASCLSDAGKPVGFFAETTPPVYGPRDASGAARAKNEARSLRQGTQGTLTAKCLPLSLSGNAVSLH